MYRLTKTHAQTNGLLATAPRTKAINLSTSLIQKVEDPWMYRCMYMNTCVYRSMYVRMIARYIDWLIMTKTHAQTNRLLATAPRTKAINMITSRIQQVEDACVYVYACKFMYVRMIAGYIG